MRRCFRRLRGSWLVAMGDESGAVTVAGRRLALLGALVLTVVLLPPVWSTLVSAMEEVAGTADPSELPVVDPAPETEGGTDLPSDEAESERTDDEPTVAASAPPSPSPSPGPSAPVTLAFGGDVHFESFLRDAVQADPAGALAPVGDLFANADVAMVNLETAVTEGGAPSPKQYNFRAPEAGLTALREAGVDIVSVANNHGMDYGEEGLRDTLAAARRADLALVGGGRTAKQAYRPHRVTVNGRRIAFFGATQVLDSFAIEAWTARSDRAGIASAKEEYEGLSRLLAAVERADGRGDTVVVMLHWGEEGASCPLPRQQELAAQLTDAGADIVVGGHAHRLQAGGFLGDAVVHYGLGNFVFYTSDGPGADSGVFAVTIAPDGSMRTNWKPAVLQGGVATGLAGDAAAAGRSSWRELRSCTDLTGRQAD
jgi:poly-gamma-glutamate capsule biosynthesis protein CapA/YwtB (metallophosphatase superfamily)